MRYKVSEIEDQIIATLQADTSNFSTVNVRTFAGQISPQMFFDPALMQGAIALLPFSLVSYQGRTNSKDNKRDSSGKTRIHKLRFRIYNGAQSLRASKEAARNAYDMIAACFDDLQSKVPVTSPQQLPGFTALSGTALTAGAVVLTPLISVEGNDETLVINLPGIVVYQSDFEIEMVA